MGKKIDSGMRICALILFAGVAWWHSSAGTNETVTTPIATNAIEAVGKESYLQLKAENEALRRENQMLRRELVAKKGTVPDVLLPEKGVVREAKIDVSGEDTGYWLAQKSKIRHNRKCRNYRKVKGKPCGPDDGKPCKMCGG